MSVEDTARAILKTAWMFKVGIHDTEKHRDSSMVNSVYGSF